MINTLLPKICDECGRRVEKLTRRHKGHGYCATCYARVFKIRSCSKCHALARLHNKEVNAICRRCERTQNCTRCGKSDIAIGKITTYGPVCNACSAHFREARPCPLCGRACKRLSRLARLNSDLQVCTRCQRMDHGTCALCHRHRILQKNKEGQQICQTCLQKGIIPCAVCKQAMPAGFGKRCESCYWKNLLAKRIEIACAAFAQPAHSEKLRQFGNWLEQTTGKKKAAITLNRYLSFFIKLSSLDKPNELPAHLSIKQIKENRLPLRFLEEIGYLTISQAARKNLAEQERIRALLTAPTSDQARVILEHYHAKLIVRLAEGKVSLSSIRLALRPAASLMQRARKASLPSQADLNAYLNETPGQRAALTGFICFLNEAFKANLVLPKRGTRPTLSSHKELEEELIKLLRSEQKSEKHRQLVIKVALSYFHHIPTKLAEKMATSARLIKTGIQAWAVLYEGRHYWLPHDLIEMHGKFFNVVAN